MTFHIPATSSSTWENWTMLIISIKECSSSNVNLDFSNCEFLYPSHVVSLACAIEVLNKKGTQVNFLCTNPKVSKYLDNIRLFQYWTPNFKRNDYTKTFLDTTLCLWQVDPDMISPYANYALQYYSTHFPGKDLWPFHTSITEILNNVNDHVIQAGNTDFEICYLLTQYYPEEKKLVLSVCDFGPGIPKKIQDFVKSTESEDITEEEGLKKAFERDFSTKSNPRNKGVGLDTLSKLVKSNKGSITVLANSIEWVQQKDGSTVLGIMKTSFPGTKIVVELNTEELKEKEDDHVDVFF